MLLLLPSDKEFCVINLLPLTSFPGRAGQKGAAVMLLLPSDKEFCVINLLPRARGPEGRGSHAAAAALRQGVLCH